MCCMTTRSGRSYQKLDPEAGVMSVDLSQMLQALTEDRQACERDLAEECERREEETKQQMELLLKLVEGVQGNRGGGQEERKGQEEVRRRTKKARRRD